MFFKKYGDLVVSIFYLILGAALIIGARALPKSKVMEIGPDFMPTVVGVLILILAALLLRNTITDFKSNAEKAEKEGPEQCDYKRVLASLVSSIVYVNVLKPVGFILSTLVYLFLQIFILAPDDQRKPKNLVLYLILDVIFTLIVYFLFRYGFKIVLPAGLIAF